MKSNLDIAHECGGIWRAGDDEPSLMCFTLTKLDAFAERIRANHLPDDGGMISEAALSHAINQASCSIDDAIETGLIRAVSKAIWRQLQAQQSAQAQPVALPAGMPEPVAWIAEYGGDVYTAAQVQAMLAQGLAPGWKAVPVKPTDAMVSAMLDWGTKQSEWEAILAAAPQPPVAQPSSAAVERKQDEALIRQMLEALENHKGNYKLTEAECIPVDKAIASAHARLERQHKRTTP